MYFGIFLFVRIKRGGVNKKKELGVIPWSLSFPLRIVGIPILTRKSVFIPNTDVPLDSFCSLHNRISIDSPRPNDFAMSRRPPWELKQNHLKTHCTKHFLKKHKYLKKPKLSVKECKFKNEKNEISNRNKLYFSKRALLNKFSEKHAVYKISLITLPLQKNTHKQMVNHYKKRFSITMLHNRIFNNIF